MNIWNIISSHMNLWNKRLDNLLTSMDSHTLFDLTFPSTDEANHQDTIIVHVQLVIPPVSTAENWHDKNALTNLIGVDVNDESYNMDDLSLMRDTPKLNR